MNVQVPKVDAAHLSVAVGLLYAFGFIVSNVHFGRYELPRLELLRARYLAAALLFILCTAVPFATGAFLSRTLRTPSAGDPVRRRDLVLRQTEAWGMGAKAFFYTLGFAVGVQALLIAQVSLTRFAAPGSNALYFIAVVMLSWQLADTLVGGEASDEAQLWPSMRAPLRVINASLWAILVPAMFSVFVYGSIRPELGGGAVWKAQLGWRPSVDSAVRSAASGIVAVVDRDDRAVSVLACARTGRPVRLTIPADDIASIRLGELVAPAAFLGNFAEDCSRLDPESVSFAQVRWKLLTFSLAVMLLSGYMLYRTIVTTRRRVTSQ